MRLLTVSLLCLAALAGVATTTSSSPLDSVVERENVSKARQAADRLLRVIRSKEFRQALSLIGKFGGPIAGSVTTILKLATGGSSGSDDQRFAREAFREINNRLESFTHEFREVKSLIDWSAVQVSYGTYERTIRALKVQLQLLIDAPRGSVDNLRQAFIMKYESDFQNAAEKIHDGIVNTDLIFSRNLLEASAKYTQNHRKRVQMFSMGLTQLLIQAVEIQIAYIDMKYSNQETTDYIKTVWNNKMQVLKEKMESYDKLLSTRWVSQIPKDAERLVLEGKNLSLAQLALKLYYFMEEKFYWRKFVAVTYKDVTGSSRHDMSFCRGFTSLGKFGKNIVLASVDSEESNFSAEAAKKLVQSLEPTERRADHVLQVLNEAGAGAEQICETYHLRLVAEESADVKVAALAQHSAMEKLCVSTFWGTTCYWVVIFG